MVNNNDSEQLKIRTEDPQLAELCRLYWEMDRNLEFRHLVSDIAKQRGLPKRQVTILVNENCQFFFPGYNCSECGTPLAINNRTEFQSIISEIEHERSFICHSCKEEKEIQRKAEQSRILEERRERVRQLFGERKSSPVDPESLSFADAIYLLAYIRVGAYEDYSAIKPLNILEYQLSPTYAMDIEILKQLYQHELLRIHPETHPDAFSQDFRTLYVDDLLWCMPSSINGDPTERWRVAADIEAIFKNEELPESWRSEDQKINVWRRVALSECYQYLKHTMEKYRFKFNPGEKTKQTFVRLLDDFSVGQMYNFIWRAARDAAAFYQRGGVSLTHAANTIVGNIERQADRAIASGWEVANYRRIPQCPESMVTHVLFYNALKLGDDWMNVPIIR